MTTMTQTATPTIELPAAGVWDLDASHSHAEFVVRHVMSKVRGRFRDFSGTITFGDSPETSHAEAVIEAGSVDTHHEDRDAHLRSPDFFDVDQYPTITFRSKRVELDDGNEFRLVGDLTIRGVTREVSLDAEYHGVSEADSVFGQRTGFSARTEVDREDFGLRWNKALDTGGFVLGNKVRLELEIEAVRRQDG
jgi:polyisoprenoid-binding protein YceI